MMKIRNEGVKEQTRATRPRFGQTMKDVANLKKPSNRTLGIQSLTTQFDVMKIKLSQLIEALKLHYSCMLQLDKSRILVSTTHQQSVNKRFARGFVLSITSLLLHNNRLQKKLLP